MARNKRKQRPQHPMPPIRTGDEVYVISGEDRGRTARKVLSVLPRQGKVVVEGVNVMKDRQKKSQQGRQSGINQQDFVEKPCPIDISNVALISSQTRKPTRIRMRTEPDGSKVRVAVKSGEVI